MSESLLILSAGEAAVVLKADRILSLRVHYLHHDDSGFRYRGSASMVLGKSYLGTPLWALLFLEQLLIPGCLVAFGSPLLLAIRERKKLQRGSP